MSLVYGFRTETGEVMLPKHVIEIVLRHGEDGKPDLNWWIQIKQQTRWKYASGSCMTNGVVGCESFNGRLNLFHYGLIWIMLVRKGFGRQLLPVISQIRRLRKDADESQALQRKQHGYA